MPRPLSPETEALVLGALETSQTLSVREIACQITRTESLVLATLARLIESGQAVREMVRSRDAYVYGYRKAS